MTDYAHLIPENDTQRLAALRAYRLLGTAPDTVFDEIVRLTAHLFDVPVALISLVDEHTVEFKGNFGLAGVDVVGREDSICSVAVLNDNTTVFADLHANPCRLTNQVAAQQLNLGFYAGHPLHTAEGYNIGALCVIDYQPRLVSGAEQERLAALAGIVLQLFDLRLALLKQPETAAAMWQAVYHSIGTSLTRIETLRALHKWEESATTEAAQRYQQSIDEEARLVTEALSAELSAVIQQLEPK